MVWKSVISQYISMVSKTACRDSRGTVAVIFAACVPALALIAGFTTDYVNMTRQRADLQTIADAAAVAGARESILADADLTQIQAAAQSHAQVNAAEIDGREGQVNVAVTVADQGTVVTVDLDRAWRPYFSALLGTGDATIHASATAALVSTGKVCVIGMQDSLVAAVHLDHDATLTANNCGVFSNSTSSWSLRVDSNATLTAEWICTVGGFGGLRSAHITPQPTTDCPPIPNPLSDRLTPPDLACDHMATVIAVDTTLTPGTYCGGLIISGLAKVQLAPGTYTIKGGALLVQDGAELTGTGVGFYLADELALFQFLPGTTISLEAPETGPLAGLLFFENPENTLLQTPRVHIITSNNARQLLGTFYLPRSVLQVDATAPVADQSAYTAIVAQRLWLRQGPNLVLNANYAATQVPVPHGLTGQRIVLID